MKHIFSSLHKRPKRAPKAKLKHFKLLSRHPFAVPLITFAVFAIVVAGGLLLANRSHPLRAVGDAKIVVISHDHSQQVVPTRAPTVGALLKKLNIALDQGDVVEPSIKTRIDQDQFRINIYRAVPVEIVDGGQRSFTFSAATTPRSIANQTGAQLYPDDLVTRTPADNFLKTGSIGEQILIDRATPVNLNLYGTQVNIRTHADTVGQLVAQKNIKLGKDDQLIPAATTVLKPNTQVFIVRNGVKIETIEEDIPKPVQQIQDASLAYGTSAVRQQGTAGHQITTYQLQLKNGVTVGRSVLQQVVTEKPVTEIVVVGTSLSGIKGDMALAGIAPGDYQYADYIISHESGWCPTKAQGQYGGCPPFAGSVPSYGGYGLCQSTPGSKMASAGADWQTNPITQLRWCAGYAIGRYGSWSAAYNHWVSYRNW